MTLLSTLKRLLAEGTQGEWRVDGCTIVAPGFQVATVNWHSGHDHERANAPLICAAHNALPRLIAMAEAAEAYVVEHARDLEPHDCAKCANLLEALAALNTEAP